MSIPILIDMNLSPDWVDELSKHGWAAAHWSAIGDPRATDREIMDWARVNSHVVFTHDLDFGTMLALTHATGPMFKTGSSNQRIPIPSLTSTAWNFHQLRPPDRGETRLTLLRHPSARPKRLARSHGTNRRGGVETTRDRFSQRCACRD
jgi:hypothetical protein